MVVVSVICLVYPPLISIHITAEPSLHCPVHSTYPWRGLNLKLQEDYNWRKITTDDGKVYAFCQVQSLFSYTCDKKLFKCCNVVSRRALRGFSRFPETIHLSGPQLSSILSLRADSSEGGKVVIQVRCPKQKWCQIPTDLCTQWQNNLSVTKIFLTKLNPAKNFWVKTIGKIIIQSEHRIDRLHYDLA